MGHYRGATVQDAQEDAYRRKLKGEPEPAKQVGDKLPHSRDATHEFMVMRFGREVLCLSDLARFDYVRWKVAGGKRQGPCNIWYRQRGASTFDRFPPPDGFFD